MTVNKLGVFFGIFGAESALFALAMLLMICLFAFGAAWLHRRRRKARQQAERDLDDYHKLAPEPFSVSAYLSRMERLSLELAREKEARKVEPIVLWWGLDGLQMNLDGTSEWISMREKPDKGVTRDCTSYTIQPRVPLAIASMLQVDPLTQAELQRRMILSQLNCCMADVYRQTQESIYQAHSVYPPISPAAYNLQTQQRLSKL